MTVVEQAKRAAIVVGPAPLERRGRRWIFGSFALCPCHLPLTLAILVTVFGGTAAGAVLRDHVVLAGAVMTTAWIAGTWRRFCLVRLAQQGACPVLEQSGVTADGDADPRGLRSCWSPLAGTASRCWGERGCTCAASRPTTRLMSACSHVRVERRGHPLSPSAGLGRAGDPQHH